MMAWTAISRNMGCAAGEAKKKMEIIFITD